MFLFFVFRDRVSLYNSPGCSGTPSVDQAGLELTEIACLCLPSTGIKGLYHYFPAVVTNSLKIKKVKRVSSQYKDTQHLEQEVLILLWEQGARGEGGTGQSWPGVQTGFRAGLELLVAKERLTQHDGIHSSPRAELNHDL